MKVLKVIAKIVIVFVLFRVGVELFAKYRLANNAEHQQKLRDIQKTMDDINTYSKDAERYLTPEDKRAIENVIK